MANPNIVNVTSIYGKTAVKDITTDITEGVLVSNSAASGNIIKINSLTIANVDGTNPADVVVDLFRSSTSYKLANTISVPADSTLVVISKDTTIYLEEGDSLRCSTPQGIGNLNAICSYEEIS